MSQSTATTPPLAVPLDPGLRRALDDLADATGRRPEDIARDAVEAWVRGEEARVREVAERLAGAHAGLLRKLGE
ncbi:hypothetical protein [Streptomyces sp. Amel2xC10]|uniref:hypothetical protein n=1 Tax=Streptomyces sp. Amel2xC10 TaxID=1305826 RepID=UPI000A09117C|nr:hypothetical protein [Streptomyces sp. Amel2xC10]SMF08531.1 hypothetical protein SAMN02745830_01543 [Streptomyces sp. Amel2xC10]